MTPFPHLKQTSQEAGGTPGVKKFQRKLQMKFKEDFFLGHPVAFNVRIRRRGNCSIRFGFLVNVANSILD